MSRRSWFRIGLAGSAAVMVLLSGCSVIQIRTAERDSGPLRVGVEQEAGVEPTESPTGAAIPEGMTRKNYDLGEDCPVDVSLAIGDDWTETDDDTPSFIVIMRGSSLSDSDRIMIMCDNAYSDSPQSIVDTQRQYSFSEQGSTLTAERTGSFGSGAFWSFQGVLGETEISAINQEPTVEYGTQIGYQINGRLVEISIEMRALQTDEAAAEDFEKMLPTLEVDGVPVPTPTYK